MSASSLGVDREVCDGHAAGPHRAAEVWEVATSCAREGGVVKALGLLILLVGTIVLLYPGFRSYYPSLPWLSRDTSLLLGGLAIAIGATTIILRRS